MKVRYLLVMLGLGLLLAACSGPADDTSPAAAAESGFKLPVSLNDVMVALVNHAADPLWVAGWRAPSSDEDWRELERRAYQLEIAGALIEHPGTGALDQKWAAKPGWQYWANALRAVGSDAVAAVEARDLSAISTVGDRTVEVCEGCHTAFKPDFPTGGKFGERSPTPSDP